VVLAGAVPTSADPSVLSIDDAVMGMPGREGMNPIDLATSAGFMFRNVSFGGKRDFVKIESGRVCLSPLLQRVMLIERFSRIQGRPWQTVFVDCLKDELLAKDKVALCGKTRIFSMSPISYTIRCKQLFGEFVSAYQVGRCSLEHRVGINVDSAEWGDLARFLIDRGWSHLVEGDYSKFGDRLPAEFVVAAYDIIIDWCQLNIVDFPVVEARCLAYESIYAFHLAGGTLYRVLGGQPSGNPLTVIVNSMVNGLLVRYAWLSIMEGTRFAGLDAFSANVKLVTYGDDLLASVSPVAAPLFNVGSLSIAFAAVGLVFTDSTKSDNPRPTVSLGEATFLKRKFVPHPILEYRRRGLFLAPLAQESVEECCQWMPRGFPDDIELQMTQDTIRLAFAGGEAYYDDVRKRLSRFWAVKKKKFRSSSWRDLNCRVFDHGEKICVLERGTVNYVW